MADRRGCNGPRALAVSLSPIAQSARATSGDGAALWAAACGCPSGIALCASPAPFEMRWVEVPASVAWYRDRAAPPAPGRCDDAGGEPAVALSAAPALVASFGSGAAHLARSLVAQRRYSLLNSTDCRDRTDGKCGRASDTARKSTTGSHRRCSWPPRLSDPELVRLRRSRLSNFDGNNRPSTVDV